MTPEDRIEKIDNLLTEALSVMKHAGEEEYEDYSLITLASAELDALKAELKETGE